MSAAAGSAERAHELLASAPDAEAGADHFLRARVHAVLGELDEARAWLVKAKGAGYGRPGKAPPDIDFEALAASEEYLSLMR